MNTNTLGKPSDLPAKIRSELDFLAKRAIQGNPNARSLWALSILELGLRIPRKLIGLIGESNGGPQIHDEIIRAELLGDEYKPYKGKDNNHLWVGKLACVLVKYLHCKNSNTIPPSITRVDERGMKRKICSSTNDDLWDVIFCAEPVYLPDPDCSFYTIGALDFNHYAGLCVNEFANITIFRTPSGFRTLEKTMSVLRELARDYAEAQYILGVSGDTTTDWLVKASDNLFELASYHLGFCRYAGNPVEAAEHLGRIDRDPMLDVDDASLNVHSPREMYLESVRRSAKRRLLHLKTEFRENEIRDKTRIEMLAALSHTLHNSQSTSREIVRSAVRILGSRPGEMSRLESGALNDLTSLYATFDFTDNLIQTFKLLVSDPQKLSVEMMNEQPDLPSIGEVVAYSLRQILVRVIFSESFVNQAFHLIGERNNKALLSLRTDFRREFLVSNEDVNASNLVDWSVKKLPGLKVTLTPNAFRLPLHNQTQYALIFAVVSEILLNSIRHAGSSQPIEISLEVVGAKATLSICNCFVGSGEKESIKLGTGGLSFIDSLTKSLCVPSFFDASFDWNIANGKFYTTLVLTDGQEHTDEHRMD